MRRKAARSAGPKLIPCIRGLAVAISSRLTTPSEVSRIAWTRIARSKPHLRLELGEQAVHVVDVPGPLDLGDHDHLELVADLGHQAKQVVEHPRALERVDPCPERRVAEVGRLRDLDQPLASRLLAVGRDRVLEVAQQDVRLGGHLGHLGRHLLVRGVEEVDHPRGLDRDLGGRLGGADGERISELAWISHD